VDPTWTEEELLAQDGIFFLKDVAGQLNIPSLEFKNQAKKLQKRGKNPWEVMGIRKTWTHWQVRMKLFAPYFKEWWDCPKVQTVEEDWNANELLANPGIYYLNDVCRKLPFTTRQIRYQMQKHDNPKEQLGVWKDQNLKSFLVDMDTFSNWIKSVWSGVRN
jgi:hypothetical protein